jgi:hypothetical protein
MRPLALFSVAAAAAASRCTDTFNDGQLFETVCYTLLVNASGGLSLRLYSGANADAMLVTTNASSSITTYQEALELTAFSILTYFSENKLDASRTVPLTLRPPTAAHDEWLAWMALAPSRWPPGSKPPPGGNVEVTIEPLGGGKGNVTLAALRVASEQSPQPSDFDALCAKLKLAVGKQLPGWSVDNASPFSPTHARYYGQMYTGSPWVIECWVGVVKV